MNKSLLSYIKIHISSCIVFFAVSAFLLRAQVPVPQNGCYLAVYTPNESGSRQGFESLARKHHAIEMIYYNWSSQKDFPSATCNQIVQALSFPLITWMPDINSGNAFQTIINGSMDEYIQKWAQQIKLWGKPLLIRFAHQMNGSWSQWDGVHNGGGNLSGFGDPLRPDGPERFIAAYRHIWQIFRNTGVSNVSWVWCVNYKSVPAEEWNKPENYYPGSDVVDWIGFDGYNWGIAKANTSWQSFQEIYSNIYTTLKSYNKPIMIGEYASAESGGSKADWILSAYEAIKTKYTLIKAVTWFNVSKDVDWRVNSSQSSLRAYQEAVSDPYFLSGVQSARGVKEEDKTEPATFTLEPAYPNPFNGYVVIPFTILQDGQYRLEIRNVLGEKVKEIIYRSYSAGKYSLSWDGLDEDNKSVPSGIYFARLSSEEEKAKIQKLVYLK